MRKSSLFRIIETHRSISIAIVCQFVVHMHTWLVMQNSLFILFGRFRQLEKACLCLSACLPEFRKCAKYPREGKRFGRTRFGLWLSLVERLVRDQEAVGSNPTSPIYHSRILFTGELCDVVTIKKRVEIGRASCLDRHLQDANLLWVL